LLGIGLLQNAKFIRKKETHCAQPSRTVAQHSITARSLEQNLVYHNKKMHFLKVMAALVCKMLLVVHVTALPNLALMSFVCICVDLRDIAPS